tara:strand:+ start:5873 stop:6112 length:240 start_codon:yes stop_codon:yes gene_type:complete
MKPQSIKFTIAQDGTVTEEVIGAVSDECLNITSPFENALGDLGGRSFKPEYYVASQHNKNKTEEKNTVDTSTLGDELSG